MVIFAGVEISQKCWQDISMEGNFHDTTTISFIKEYGLYFYAGVNIREDKSAKNAKIPPRENFHVYSIIHHKCCVSALVSSYLHLRIIAVQVAWL